MTLADLLVIASSILAVGLIALAVGAGFATLILGAVERRRWPS